MNDRPTPNERPTTAMTQTDDDDAGRLIAIYLNDHRAGSAGGQALAERCAGSNQDNDLGRYLVEEFLPQLQEERRLVQRVRARLDVRDNPVKQFAARAAELLGRAKTNGQLRGYSPLSRIVELEALIAAVSTKRQLWRLLGSLTTVDDSVFEARLRDADTQRERLEEFHRAFAVELFGGVVADDPETEPTST
ncbi:MAG: hypothetical protein ABIP17_07495 [Ilumatobacteraceae bacterium]